MRLVHLLSTFLPVALLGSAGFVSYCVGQEGGERGSQDPLRTSAETLVDEIPPAALLTDRGEQLALRLRFLRQSEQTMGKKHPQRENVRAEIESIKRELTAWASIDPQELESDDGSATGLPAMNDRDLRQLVLQLAGKVEQLETRVAELEQRSVGR